MSFILDALRRAEAERERERQPVPGLHSNSWLPPELRPVAKAPLRRWAQAAIGAMALLAGVAVAWAMWARLGTPSPAAEPAGAASAAPRVAAPAPIEPAPTALPQRSTAPPAPVVSISGARPGPAPVTVAAAAAGPLSAAAVPPSALGPASAAPSAVPAPAPSPAPPLAQVAAPPSASAAPAASPAVTPLAQLPEPLRGAVQRLAITGGVHSVDPRQSFVLAAGQIVREGGALPGGATVERILPRAVWLRVEGRLVEVAY